MPRKSHDCKRKRKWKTLFIIVIWAIWKERNCHLSILRRKPSPIEPMLGRVKFYAAAWVPHEYFHIDSHDMLVWDCFLFSYVQSFHSSWSRPLPGPFKLHIDGSETCNPRTAANEEIIWDSTTGCIISYWLIKLHYQFLHLFGWITSNEYLLHRGFNTWTS